LLCWLAWELSKARAEARRQTIASAWLLAASASACIGLMQYLGNAAHFTPWINFVEAGQAYGNLRQRNQQATLLAIGICALLWWQARVRQSAPEPNNLSPSRGVLAGAVLLLGSADAATGSRTGLLQLVLLLALALLWRRGRATIVFALLAYAAAAFLLPHLAGLEPLQSGILGRLGEPTSTCGSRLTLWANVLHLIAQKPWTGWGWGELGYAHFITLYDGPRFCEIMGNAHNLPLHLAVVLGLPLALLFCCAFIWLVLRLKPWRETDRTRQMAWRVLAVIGLHSLLEYPLWYGPFQLAAVLAIWLLWNTRPKNTAYIQQPSTQPARWPALLTSVALLACSYVAWDYWRISQIYLSPPQRAAAYQEDTLEKIRPSWLFADQVRFAELGITPLSAANAETQHALALELLHFSPEASVAVKAIESAALLGRDDAVQYYSQRLQIAYPQEYASWMAAKTMGPRDKTP
jgi:O-antigen ligase